MVTAGGSAKRAGAGSRALAAALAVAVLQWGRKTAGENTKKQNTNRPWPAALVAKQWGLRQQQRLKLFGGNRLGIQPALGVVAAETGQQLALRIGLYTLGNHF